MDSRLSHPEIKRQPAFNNSIKLLGIRFFPILGIAGSITYMLLIIVGWILIAVVGSNLFKLVGANFQIIFVALVIILAGQATISFLNIQLHIPNRKSLSSFVIVLALSVIYWLLFVASSVGQFNAWSSNPPSTDNEGVLWFALAYACITPMFIGLLIGQIAGYNKSKLTQLFNSKHITLPPEENKNMEAALVAQAMGFLTAVGSWSMSELSEIWKIKRQKEIVSSEPKTDVAEFTIDLSNREQIKEVDVKTAMAVAIQQIGEAKVFHSLELIQENHNSIQNLKMRLIFLDDSVTEGEKDPVDARMQRRKIHKDIEKKLGEIEKEMNAIGWIVDKEPIAKD